MAAQAFGRQGKRHGSRSGAGLAGQLATVIDIAALKR